MNCYICDKVPVAKMVCDPCMALYVMPMIDVVEASAKATEAKAAEPKVAPQQRGVPLATAVVCAVLNTDERLTHCGRTYGADEHGLTLTSLWGKATCPACLRRRA